MYGQFTTSSRYCAPAREAESRENINQAIKLLSGDALATRYLLESVVTDTTESHVFCSEPLYRCLATRAGFDLVTECSRGRRGLEHRLFLVRSKPVVERVADCTPTEEHDKMRRRSLRVSLS